VSRADALIQAFYEDADLRDALTDDEAEVLLRWAAGQAARLDAGGAEDAAFDALARELRRLIREINRFAGEGLYAPHEAQAEALTAIGQGAQAVGLSMLPSFSAQAAPADPMAALTGLLARLTPSAEDAPPTLEAQSAAGIAAAEATPLPAEPSTEPPPPPTPPVPPAPDEEWYDL